MKSTHFFLKVHKEKIFNCFVKYDLYLTVKVAIISHALHLRDECEIESHALRDEI